MNNTTSPTDLSFLADVPGDSIIKLVEACKTLLVRRCTPEFDVTLDVGLHSRPCCPAHVWNAMLDHCERAEDDPARSSEAAYESLLEQARACHLTAEHVAHEVGLPHLSAKITPLLVYVATQSVDALYKALEAAGHMHFRDRRFGADLGL